MERTEIDIKTEQKKIRKKANLKRKKIGKSPPNIK